MLGVVLALTLVVVLTVMAIPMSSQNVWTLDEVSEHDGLVVGALLGAAGTWIVDQLTTYPSGHRRIWEHLRIAAYSLVVLAIIPLPLLAFHWGFSVRIAGVMAPEVLQREVGYHRANDYWCSNKLDDVVIARERNRLDASLALFGLSTSGQMTEKLGETGRRLVSCAPVPMLADAQRSKPCKCLKVFAAEEEVGVEFLRERLESVETSQAPATDVRSALTGWSAFAGAIALAMALISALRPAWMRRFSAIGFFGVARKWSEPGWFVGGLRRLDHRLLIDRPIDWATRLHVPATFTLVVALMILLDPIALVHEHQGLVYGLVLLSWPICLWVSLAVTTPLTKPHDLHRTLLLRFLVNAMPLLMVTAAVDWVGGEPSNMAAPIWRFDLVLAAFLACQAVSASFGPEKPMATFWGVVARFLADGLMLVCFLVLLKLGLSQSQRLIESISDLRLDSALYMDFGSVAVWIAVERLVVWWGQRRASDSEVIRGALRVLLMAAPAVFLYPASMAGLMLADALELDYLQNRQVADALLDLEVVLTGWLLFAFNIFVLYLTLRWFVTPILRTLVRLRVAPADTSEVPLAWWWWVSGRG